MQMPFIDARLGRFEDENLRVGEILPERLDRVEQRRVARAAARPGRVALELLGAEGPF